MISFDNFPSLDSPKTIKQFMFNSNISARDLAIALILNLISVVSKDVLLYILPSIFILIILLFGKSISFKALAGDTPNINLHFYLINEQGQFSLIDKSKCFQGSNFCDEQFNPKEILEMLNKKFSLNDFKCENNISEKLSSINAKAPVVSTNNSNSSISNASSITTDSISAKSATVCTSVVSSNSISPVFSTPVVMSQTKTDTMSDSNNIQSVSSSMTADLKFPPKLFSTDAIEETVQVANQNSKLSNSNLVIQDCKDFDPSNYASLNFKNPFISKQITNSNISMTEINSALSILPKFSGDLQAYRGFKCKFVTLTNSFIFSDSEKAILLYLSLSDEVVDSLGKITTGGNIDYDILWDKLNCEYYRPQHGLMYHGAALNSLSEWGVCNTLEDLNKLYNFILKHHRALEREGEIGGDLAVGMMVLSKIDGELSENVSHILANPPSNCSVIEKILTTIKNHINYLEICNLTCPSENTILSSSNDILNALSNNELDCQISNLPEVKNIPKSCLKQKYLNDTESCLFCRQNTHSSHDCKLYNDPFSFKQLIFRNFLCYNCLQVGHKSYGCPYSKVCNLCTDTRKHSNILCNKRYHFLN